MTHPTVFTRRKILTLAAGASAVLIFDSSPRRATWPKTPVLTEAQRQQLIEWVA
ncbi:MULTISPECIES: hypothetical protein [unclassified Pseudomonas]|uniref:hypothetical protein n=1 Tax=unclassified Pseudomonas TaxID=196821 RepID=UPI002AC92C47|nr:MULTISPECIES: hypothetical protein [unclassified Pseudomonas]MEB0039803.1 hypothetical protein [Pseudomonas sp. MH10]MEB0077255.1 hypothetical protein [Pseudomonas sp. MH10out]MEB0091414.1 hypothetical protein [Pseudomonas sp. CCI4.2]MEB0101602.1 hypothetical protein [Pseudomonas sp. CCI3.2]MEB0120711.1 hypothetical protein [Pseudomonas sp. CCI1.2]